MGIRGTVRRSTDGHFVHCNVDTDVIVWEDDETDPLRKPPELYDLIENFCMGTRRLELFGNARDVRPGWLTLGMDDPPKRSEPEALSAARVEASQAKESQPDLKVEEEEHNTADEERAFPSLLSPPMASKAEAAPAVAQEEDAGPSAQPYDKATYDAHFRDEQRARGGNLVPTTSEVDALRPRSPGPPSSAGRNMRAATSGPPGHVAHPLPALPPGMKVNPQGIGRHTNRSATPSASQHLEMQLMQERAAAQQQQQQQQQEHERLRLQHQQMQQAQMQMQAQAQWMQQQQQFMQAMQQQGAFGGMGFNPMAMGMGAMIVPGQLNGYQQQLQGGTVGMSGDGFASPGYQQHMQQIPGAPHSQGAMMGMQQGYPNHQQQGGAHLNQFGANAGFSTNPSQHHQQQF